MSYTLHTGDCLAVMGTMEANSCDTIVTDPPYGLAFMGKEWDHGVPGVPFWEAALRVAKPGAMLLAFGGTRTFHRLTCAIEDAGWEVRDVIIWLYGSGFPKSHDISKGIDKAAGAEREIVGVAAGMGRQNPAWNGTGAGRKENSLKPEYAQTAPATLLAQQWQGWGTALKPAWEPIIVAMKPLDGTFAQNAAKHGVAGLNIEGARIGAGEPVAAHHGTNGANGRTLGSRNEYRIGDSGSVFQSAGRWPANLILDEDAAAALDAQSGESKSPPVGSTCYGAGNTDKYGWANTDVATRPRISNGFGDSGGASRFFYVAKASRAEREAGMEGQQSNGRQGNRPGSPDPSGKFPDHDHRERGGNHHPTVKPLTLMRYLVRLTATPTGGVVLDPFMGSGTTGVAAMMEGRTFIGIEREPEYVEIARRRIEHAAALPRQEGLL